MVPMHNYKSGITDTHAHIGDPAFDADRTSVLESARAVGITTVIAVSEDILDAKRNIALASKHPILRPAAGLYPTRTDLRQREKLVAIGEVGLDYWVVKEKSEREIQEAIFRMFIDLSVEVDLPLNVHSRSAGRQAVAMLIEGNARKVQLHAFDGKAATAMSAIDAGYFFSIPPSVVRSRQKQKLLKHLPTSCLLIESDCPVLGPSPQERNVPSNAIIGIKAISEIKGIAEEEVVERIADNTRRLYGF